ncbi:m-phase inducer phosphatase 1 [Caerostris extrusa]|uniref:protein-tyrosine-phosphatase n=1 Tax=Caerostris extrusa TaxID=172846 RepID=A0AAV4Y7W6_CAEEX|nr:m-phase inducer phosphatase 1 [Caerostris extrusa]
MGVNPKLSRPRDDLAFLFPYPYEYHGGHIQGAENIYTKDVILERFFVKPEETKGTVLIFHCEFSSERAPSLCRFVRNRDRLLNQGNYPKLNHPELYILDGGYKKFYQQYKELCEPQNYKPMKHKDHSSDLRQFRAKSKSWGAECKSRVFLRSSSKSDVI